MGNTWAVEVFGMQTPEGPRTWHRVYGGESLLGMIRAFWKHRSQWKCIRIEYRP